MKLWICTTKEFMHKLTETVFRVLKFGIVTNFSVKMHTFDGPWHAGEVCSSLMNPGLNCTGQMADSECSRVKIVIPSNFKLIVHTAEQNNQGEGQWQKPVNRNIPSSDGIGESDRYDRQELYF